MRSQPFFFWVAPMAAFAYPKYGEVILKDFSRNCSFPNLIEGGSVLKTACCFGSCMAGQEAANKLDLNLCIGIDVAGTLRWEVKLVSPFQ
jgi:hypothetical protein